MKKLSELPDEVLARRAREAEPGLPDAPHWLIESALSMWQAPTPQASLGRRIAAVLGFDSWALQPVPALRAGPQEGRQWLFCAEGRDVDLHALPSAAPPGVPARFALTGQVLGPGDGGELSIGRDGDPVATIALDEFGEFKLADLAPGTYAISLRFGDDVIVLPDIELGGDARR